MATTSAEGTRPLYCSHILVVWLVACCPLRQSKPAFCHARAVICLMGALLNHIMPLSSTCCLQTHVPLPYAMPAVQAAIWCDRVLKCGLLFTTVSVTVALASKIIIGMLYTKRHSGKLLAALQVSMEAGLQWSTRQVSGSDIVTPGRVWRSCLRRSRPDKHPNTSPSQ